MKVLFVEFDLFASIGGGQTYYRSVIQKNPHLEFYYFLQRERPDALRPANAHGIPFQEIFHPDDFAQSSTALHGSVLAANIAASVAHQSFDIVEAPDYRQVAGFLAPALTEYAVHFAHIALGMHGVVSTTNDFNWPTQRHYDNSPIAELERLQFRASDMRIGISQRYIKHWQKLSGYSAHYYHPFYFFTAPSRLKYATSNSLPTLDFIGRKDRGKGPDLLLEILWWLNRNSYSRARLIGPEAFNQEGVSSTQFLEQLRQHRMSDVELVEGLSAEELGNVFASQSIVFVPSRRDTFNLLALESLLAGCPTFIGDGAGICDFLDTEHPAIPYGRFDTRAPHNSIVAIEDMCQNYARHREQLAHALDKQKFIPTGKTLEDIYSAPLSIDQDARQQFKTMYRDLASQRVMPKSASVRAKRLTRKLFRLPQKATRVVKSIINRHLAQPESENISHSSARDALIIRWDLSALPQNDPIILADQRKPERHYRAAVIVAMDDSSTKLTHCLRHLLLQTAIKNNDIEIVLIDRALPISEHAAVQESLQDLPYVFARSHEHESIQCAWNRGVTLARAPYVAFLNVNECLSPDALALLSNELDAHPTIDWVQGSTLVTEVDEDGNWLNDKFFDDRSDFAQGIVNCDSHFVTHVGALHRRTIHSSATSTLNLKYIPHSLGRILDYSSANAARTRACTVR